MSYIRERTEERTCYQESSPYSGAIDFGNDFVCVYGVDPGMPERVRRFRERGYVIHLMTGIAWGNYREYLDGSWDGREHWDEIQRDREGMVSGFWIHTYGYMVPTIAFTDYLTERLKAAVDAGVEAIHVEEPEFLGSGGYSEAFKREYLLHYHEAWTPPHTSVDAHHRASQLKAYLYRRAIERISTQLREYAMVKYNRVLRFYVPTHSLLNYSQWKVMSPEGMLIDVPSLDGYKAQIWMGTSREPNVYRGVYRERTFETAFLEYGVMQELVRETGRTMWFDNDPIEDNPRFGWDNYRVNYIKTLMGSLLQPHINRFQICPWPTRIFGPNAKYPRGAVDAKPIPADYATLLCNIFQTLGTLGTDNFEFAHPYPPTGVFLSDSAMFQREFPDEERARRTPGDEVYPPEMSIARGDDLAFSASVAFPHFYGLALPLLKGGLPVRPVQLENITRFPTYLDEYKLLVLSYEFLKPATASTNSALAHYVMGGGTLLYCGDGRDPFHAIRAWWNSGAMSDPSALESLLRLLNLPEDAPDGIYACGKGRFALMRRSPASLCLKQDGAREYRDLVAELLGMPLDQNNIVLRRGPYTVTAVMDECDSDEPVIHEGLFVDMLTTEFDIVRQKTVRPNEYALLFDLRAIAGQSLCVVGSSARIEALSSGGEGFTLRACGPDNIRMNIRVRLPGRPTGAQGRLAPADAAEGEPVRAVEVACAWDEDSRTALLSYDGAAGAMTITGVYAR